MVENGEIPFAENGKGNSFWYNSLRFHVHMRKTQWIFVNIERYIYIYHIDDHSLQLRDIGNIVAPRSTIWDGHSFQKNGWRSKDPTSCC